MAEARNKFSILPPIDSPESKRRLSLRLGLDWLVRHSMVFGGVSIIIAILLIFFYLFYVVLPLFKPAEAEQRAQYAVPGPAAHTAHLAIEEQAELGVRFTQEGQAIFFTLREGAVVSEEKIALPTGVAITSVAAGSPTDHMVAYGLANGQAVIVQHHYQVSYPEDKRLITPVLLYPFETKPVVVDPLRRPLIKIAVQNDGEQATIIAVTADRRLVMTHILQETSFLEQTTTLRTEHVTLPPVQEQVTHLLLERDQNRLYAADATGNVAFFNLRDKSAPLLMQRLRVVDENRQITSFSFLIGGTSIIVGDDRGHLAQWFPVRDERNNDVLTHIRDFDRQKAPITALAPEHQRKGFIAADQKGIVGIYHATANRTLMRKPVAAAPIHQLAIAPRADAMLAEDAQGQLYFWHIVNEHPEISWSALWGKVWYENYPKPDYIWQSTSATSDFEPKFSLVPLSFGTLKAAFYAMLIAMPLAIMGAIYTAQFMAPRMRRVVKPSIEIMEALPTVILGFLAGLWLAPLVEKYLPGIFSLLLLLPTSILIFAYVYGRLPSAWRHSVPDGWEPALLVPVVILVGWFSLLVSPWLELWWFAGDMRSWLTREMGISFDQRNAIIVGFAMGFAVIPTIYSIAEDAIFGVPKHLTHGSLALGATPWQTVWRVVLLTASPGIFSAVMIGLGRAVGETMIVLMATGNTPVMDFSAFQGMRTLSANIAVEMPESEVNSTHYRVLFLAALVLFVFTFMFNTLAEVVRQRLRKKYSSL